MGISLTSFEPTVIAFQLGSVYGAAPQTYQLKSGDSFTIGVEGATFSGTVTYKS